MKNCKTCNHLIPEDARFCSNCGAKYVTNRLTIAALLNSLVLRFANLDFSFYRTTKWLIIKPKLVTIGYINGVRKVINAPIQYAIIVLSLYGIFQFVFSDFLDLILERNFLSGLWDGFNNYEVREDEQYKRLDNAISWLQSRNQFLFFLMIPLLAFFSKLFYRKNGYNYAEHVVISIYAVSFTLVFSVLSGLILGSFGNATAVEVYLTSTTIFNVVAVTYIFGRSLKGSFLKPLFVLIISSFVTLILFSIVLLSSIP